MLDIKLVGELTTKGAFNKYMGYTGYDVPSKEDKKAKGYIVEMEGEANHLEHEGYLVWLPEAVYLASVKEGAEGTENQDELLVEVASNPGVYATLSPKKQKRVQELVKAGL